MAVQAGFATYCCELLASVGPVHSKRMFGGYGLYVEAMDSPRLMEPWARLALEAALRARAKPGRRR